MNYKTKSVHQTCDVNYASAIFEMLSPENKELAYEFLKYLNKMERYERKKEMCR
ncbi:hypothetical protein NE664_06450 [Anaerotignum faecicola]|nr:hypothetical protein [Anaerotignum faecicola]